MARAHGRRANELRPVSMTRGFLKNSPSSVLIEMGKTRVICCATVEEGVPHFLKGSGAGWITAEYGMLPGSTLQRVSRTRGGVGGRTAEIQRLLGRCLRAVARLDRLPEMTLRIDCDVLDADGGTRTAAITGAWVALADAIGRLEDKGAVKRGVLGSPLAAVSVGMVGGRALVDLDYSEDSIADVDMNVAMTTSGRFVEIQGTAESAPFSRKELDAMLRLAAGGIRRLIRIQREVLAP